MQGLVPLYFAAVDAKVYRSSYPARKSLLFIEKLHLKTMVCLNPVDLKSDVRHFCQDRGIALLEMNVGFNQEPFIWMNADVVAEVLKIISDPGHAPCLVFSNKDARTNCVIGCYRKIYQNWSIVSIFQEIEQYTTAEGSILDYAFVERFQLMR